MPINPSTIQFLGRVEKIQPTSGSHDGPWLTHVTAFDWMDEAAKFSLRGIMAEKNLRADEVISRILNIMENKPHEVLISTGSDVYPVALDNAKDETTTAQIELSRVALSEIGLIYVAGGGSFVFENRGTRGAASTVLATLDNTVANLEAVDSTESVINRARITVHPRRVDVSATTVLYKSESRIGIDAGPNTEIFLKFRDPTQKAARVGGLDVVKPVPTTDYTINTAQDGSGLDVTGNPAIVVSFTDEEGNPTLGGNGVYLNVENNFGAQVFIDIQVRGRGVYDFEPITVIESNLPSIKDDGIRETSIDMPYQTSAPLAQAAGQLILNTFAPLDVSRLRSLSYPARKNVALANVSLDAEISARLAVIEDQTAINGEFFINGIQHTWNIDRFIITRFNLTPASTSEVWIMNVSQLDINTRLGFG